MRCVGSFLCVWESICVVQRFDVAAIAFFFRLHYALAVCMRMKHSTVQYFSSTVCQCLLRFCYFSFLSSSSVFVSMPRSMCVDSLLLLSVGRPVVRMRSTARFRMVFCYHAFDTNCHNVYGMRSFERTHAREREREIRNS